MSRTENADRRVRVPRTDALLATPTALEGIRDYGRSHVKNVIRQVQDAVRSGSISVDDLDAELRARLARGLIGIRPVLNGTGVLVHTNLGRSPLSSAALTAIAAAAGTCDVELDLQTGRRGVRGDSLNEALLAQVAPAAGAHVVNNGAAAIALVAMAFGRDDALDRLRGNAQLDNSHHGTGESAASGGSLPNEVIVSRGELIEIGAGFRLPDLIEATGVRIREVGTTNRTHLRDYQDAINDRTRLILKIHPSNYRVEGFTAGVSVAELSTLGVPVVSDIGSGLLHPHPALPDEPDATTHLADGAAIVTASGDKLLGGPQAGLIFTASADVAAALKRHPMARAYRVDKLTLAALEATILGPTAPVIAMLETSAADLRSRAENLVGRLDGIDARAVDSTSTVGGGGAPGSELASAAIGLPERFAAALRRGAFPVMSRVENGRCIVDLRAIDPADLDRLTDAIRDAARDDSIRDDSSRGADRDDSSRGAAAGTQSRDPAAHGE